MLKKTFSLLLLPLLLGGCAASITNLSSRQQTRNNTHLYPVEASFHSRQQSLRWDSIHPQIVVGNDFYPMRPVPLMTNRWEGLVTVPAGSSVVHYHYKFDFLYNTFGGPPLPDSASSAEFTLKVVDR